MTDTHYRPQFDGLRALAVLEVVAFHCRMQFAPAGWIGVDLFFALSAFLITSLLVAEFHKTSTISLSRFYLRRVRRIVPALVALVFGYAALAALMGRTAKTIAVDSALALSGVANWTRAYGVWGPRDLAHLWSLAIEIQFYLVWPLFALFLLRQSTLDRSLLARAQRKLFHRISLRQLGLLVLIAGVAVALYRYELIRIGTRASRIYNGFDTRVDGFLFGAGFAFIVSCERFQSSKFKLLLVRFAPALTMLLLVVHGILLFTFDLGKWRDSAFSGTWIALSSAALVAAAFALQGGVIHRVLSWAPIRNLGVVSYGVYLWHYPLIHLLPLKEFPGWERFAVIASLSIVCASISYQLIERSFLYRRGGVSEAIRESQAEIDFAKTMRESNEIQSFSRQPLGSSRKPIRTNSPEVAQRTFPSVRSTVHAGWSLSRKPLT